MPSVLEVCRLQFSWLDLAALVVSHAGALFAVLSTNVVSELSSTEQTKEDGGEIDGHEAHDLSSSRTSSLLVT